MALNYSFIVACQKSVVVATANWVDQATLRLICNNLPGIVAMQFVFGACIPSLQLFRWEPLNFAPSTSMLRMSNGWWANIGKTN